MVLTMKRKIIMVATILLSCLLLGGCECSENIEICGRSGLTKDSTCIDIDLKYHLKDYDKEYTENGCIVHIYYEIKE